VGVSEKSTSPRGEAGLPTVAERNFRGGVGEAVLGVRREASYVRGVSESEVSAVTVVRKRRTRSEALEALRGRERCGVLHEAGRLGDGIVGVVWGSEKDMEVL
jgi:hypothetical protein